MAIGILVSDGVGYSSAIANSLVIALLSLFLLLLSLFRLESRRKRGWFGIAVSLFFLLLGGWLVQHAWQQRIVTWQPNEQLYKAFILEPPQPRQDGYVLLVEVEQQQVLLYVDKAEEVVDWSMGQELYFHGVIRAPRNAGNPAEFDYARYLLLRGITGRAWVEREYCKVGALKRKLTWKQQALLMRQQVVESYRSWGIMGDNLAVLAALTVGHKEDVTTQLKSDYAAAGLSHLLALSGLHVGVIWGCISFLFRGLGRSIWTRLMRCLLVLAALWLFAFVGGLTPSLVRAVVMCSLMELSYLRQGRVYSLHTLTIAAWAMLLYNPFYLFELGFQLSFLAVLAIILISPLLTAPFYAAKRWVRYWVQSVAVTVAAQLGTAPLSIYYFSLFPTCFLVTNLAVVLLLPFLLFGTLLTFSLFFWPWGQMLLATVLNGGITLLNGVAQGVSRFAYAVWEVNQFSFFSLCLLYALLGWMLYRFYRRGRGSRKSWLVLLSLFSLYGCIEVWNVVASHSTSYMLFYNQRQLPAVHLVQNNSDSWLVTTRPDSVMERMSYIATTHWKQEKLAPQIIPLYQDSLAINTQEGLFEWKGKRICMVADRRWVNRTTSDRLEIDYLYLCKGFSGDISSLTAHFNVATVVLDAALSRYYVERVVAACDSLQLPCIDLASTGAYKVSL
ncbi:MAG: ComEC/Rec2 family competence protein [Phocaeicola sp.]